MKKRICNFLLACLSWMSIQAHGQGFLSQGTYNVSSINYDENGNLLTLKRDGVAGSVDNLSYSYDGNRLLQVEDTGTDDIFNNRVTLPVEFLYDANGNMVRDLNKDIDTIYYNRLNLPDTVVFNNGVKVTYTYLADGRKVKHEVVGSDGKWLSKKEYSGGVIYNNGLVEEAMTLKGRMVFNRHNNSLLNNGEYQYHIKDVLGNNRMLLTAHNKVGKFTADYEAAENMAYANYAEVTRINNSLFNHTDEGSYVERLSGDSGTCQVVGCIPRRYSEYGGVYETLHTYQYQYERCR